MRRLLFLLFLTALLGNTLEAQKSMKRNTLTKEEQRVIINKGTERAYTGEYTDTKESGTYLCKWCDAQLYKSSDKFDSHCGWPSFDDEIDGAIEKHTDLDGSRTEIVCTNCQGHLGHVFMGEGYTNKNVRHCVNSISLKFIPDSKMDKVNIETAIFAGGCFWGVEHLFKQQSGILDLEVGYIGGHKENPTYKEICYENTGHAEAIRIKFDTNVVSFKELAKLFFEIHDPTQMDRQGPDIGDQYRSEVFYTNEKQKSITLELIDSLKAKGLDIVTVVSKAATFWPAENYHQDYYNNNGGTPYCHIYTKRF